MTPLQERKGNYTISPPHHAGVFRRLPQRERAAFTAILRRCRTVSFKALALPPLNPPNRPNATAAGFFPDGGATFCLVAAATIQAAAWFGSAGGFLLERFCIQVHSLSSCVRSGGEKL